MRNRRLLISGVVLAALMAWRHPAAADVLVLTNGNTYYGEVLEQTDRHVVFRFELNGGWVTQRISMAEVERVAREDGDQSDGAAAGKTEPASSNPPRSDRPVEAGGPTVVILPLHGEVGGVPATGQTETFDAWIVRDRLEAAARAKATTVLLDIDSPGGRVSEMEDICSEIIERGKTMRIVAFAHDALSAAAIISLCCREIVVHPRARLGAAVIIMIQGRTVDAVSAKFASPHHARWKEFMSASGRPWELVQAMTIQEAALWWSPAHGFTSEERRTTTGDDWTQVDGSTTVLTMTADEAQRWGVAIGRAADARAALALLGVAHTVNLVDDAAAVRQYNAGLRQKLKAVNDSVDNYFGSLSSLVKSMNGLADAYNARDRDAATMRKLEIGQQVTRMRVAAQQLRSVNKSVLARRIEIPGRAIDQLQADAKLLGRVTLALSADTYEGFADARERVNTVLEEWRALLKKDAQGSPGE